jgi:hypothetical protein
MTPEFSEKKIFSNLYFYEKSKKKYFSKLIFKRKCLTNRKNFPKLKGIGVERGSRLKIGFARKI